MKIQAIRLSSYLALASYVSGTTIERNTTSSNLNYNAWRLAGPTTPGVPVDIGGLASESDPNNTITSFAEQLTKGTPSIAIAPPQKPFSLYDFYFGCVVRMDEGVLAAVTQCTITVAGFLANSDQEVAIASYTFTLPVSPIALVPMMHAVLPDSFHLPLYNVTMIQQNGALTEPTALRVDNVHYFVSS